MNGQLINDVQYICNFTTFCDLMKCDVQTSGCC